MKFTLLIDGQRVNMNHKVLINVCLLFLLCSPGSEAKISGVLKIFTTGVDIFKSGYEIAEFIREINSNPMADVQDLLEEIRKDMERMISSATTTIITEITAQIKLEKLKDIIRELNSLLIDLENYIEAKNETDRLSYKQLFLERFDQRVASMVRDLATFLTETNQGFSKPLTELICDKNYCNMTANYEFQMFFANLIVDASTLQLAFRELSGIPADDVEEFWTEKLPGIQLQFDSMEALCKKRFPKFAAEEIKQGVDANALYKNCKQRYTWAFCVILYYAPMGTHQFHYHKTITDFIFWNGASSSGRNQIAVIGDIEKAPKAWNQEDMNSELKSNVSSFKAAISGSEDVSAALKVGVAVEKYINDKGVQVKGVVVFFDATTLETMSRIVDESSPAAYVLVENVTLKYCFSGGVACTFAKWDLFNFNDDWKEYTGRFHVYVFPCESNGDCSTHSTSAAFSHTKSCPVFAQFFSFICAAALAVIHM